MVVLPLLSYSQFGGLLNKIKDKALTAAERKVDEAANSLQKNKGEKSGPAIEMTGDKKKVPTITSYSKFDFVPGEKVIYAEDFSQDPVGEFPLTWKTKAKGEIVKVSGQPGNWLRGYKEGTITSVNNRELGENYTVEFDLIYYFGAEAPIYVMPDIIVRFLNNYAVDYKNTSGNISEREGEKSFQFTVHPKEDASLAWVETYGQKPEFTSEKTQVSSFSGSYNQVIHYAIQVQKSRVRIWMNEKKIFDLPQVLENPTKVARIAFKMGSSSFDENQVGYYVSNIRMATGSADTRHKLLDSGKFTTSGILFDVNSDQILPESSGLLNELAGIMKESPDLKFRICGHTSSDGQASANLELSKRRSQSVKDFLVKSGVAEARLVTDGLGDTDPVASNSTKEGRLQNRRVEFTRL